MAIALFYISLILLVGFITIKSLEIYYDRKHVLSQVICRGDDYCHELVGKTRHVISKIKFKNFHRLVVLIAEFIKRETIILKRKFDSKQPKFFLKTVSYKPDSSKKGSVSFFLKNVSDYKNSLKSKE
ncbi:MAG: hypothetical protein WC631_00245 [Candidatus Paceibacterota bacterium]|jgi:hypothetical protein